MAHYLTTAAAEKKGTEVTEAFQIVMDEIQNKEPAGYYKFGLFYYEENNTRLIVRSPNNRYTLNFANKWAYVIEAVFFVIVILKILATAGVIQ